MIKNITYKGGFITDTNIEGERKADGIIPAHANGSIQVSQDKWMTFVATLHTNGWDAVRSIVYQLRVNSPDGPIIKEGVVSPAISGWDPFNQGVSLRKLNGMPMAFGVPKGAKQRGQLLPNHNVFAVKWYRYAMLEKDGRLLNPGHHQDVWPEGPEMKKRLLRIEWTQFRLNDAETDIEFLMSPRVLCQNGYDNEEEFSELGPNAHMNHAMVPPVTDDDDYQRWYEVDTFMSSANDPDRIHGQIAPVEYVWNTETGLYEWTRLGPITGYDDQVIGETSTSHVDGHWLVAVRSWTRGGATLWFRAEDLFAGLGKPTYRPTTWGPRHSYKCGDGQLRIFHNDQNLSPYGDKRNPLYMFEVDPETFEYSEAQDIFDARKAGLTLDPPLSDMSKLCPNQGNRQLLVFRCIDDTMTTDREDEDENRYSRKLSEAGVHYLKIEYEGDCPGPWEF